MTPETDYRALMFYSGILQWVINGLIVIYLWIRDRKQASKKELNDKLKSQDNRLAAQEKDILLLQQKIERLPPCSHHDGLETHMKELDGRMEDVQAKTNKICGRMEGFGNALDLIQQHLLSQKKGT